MARRTPLKRRVSLPYKPQGDEYFDADIYNGMPLKFQLIAMLYLIEKHTDACIYMPDIDKELTSDTPSFLSIAVQWWVATQRLYFPRRPNFWQFFDQCKRMGARFIIVYLVHDAEEVGLDNHMNILVYDKTENTFERFEPNALAMPSTYHVDKLDKALNRVCKSHGIEYIAPRQICPMTDGIQVLQHRETKGKAKIAGDIGGWCQSWSLFYADMRLSFPDIPRDTLLMDAIELFKDKSMTRYIRDYTYYVAKRARQINSINDYKRIALESIKHHKYQYYIPVISAARVNPNRRFP